MAIKYKWLASELREQLPAYMKKGQQKLPPEAELCKTYHVSRQTVRQSLALLESEGLITRRQGSGSYLTGLLSDNSRNTVVLLISDEQSYIYPEVISDIQYTMSSHGFSCHIYSTYNQIGTERRYLLSLLNEPPRGLIVEGCKSALPNPNLDLYQKLEKKGCSVLFLYNYYHDYASCLFLKDDNRYGSRLLVQHLHQQGHTSIGCIFKSDDLQGQERYQGYLEAMLELHLPISDNRILWFNSGMLDRLRSGKELPFLSPLFQTAFSDCTAVICYNDEIAYHLMAEMEQLGYHLPDDIALAAFDNTYLSETDRLSVTTLSHQKHEMGTKAARMLLDKIKGLPVRSQEIPWKLTRKESTSSRFSS